MLLDRYINNSNDKQKYYFIHSKAHFYCTYITVGCFKCKLWFSWTLKIKKKKHPNSNSKLCLTSYILFNLYRNQSVKMTVHHFTGISVPDSFFARHSNFLESPLVAWQLLRGKKLSNMSHNLHPNIFSKISNYSFKESALGWSVWKSNLKEKTNKLLTAFFEIGWTQTKCIHHDGVTFTAQIRT